MCGLVGMINMDGEPVSSEILKEMTNSLFHRGPDGEGQYIDRSVGLGHRRLAIIDLSEAANQPMVHESKNLIIAYNGEVYNFGELRQELKQLGHRFRTSSDTEVVLHSYEQWGVNCLSRFNGMFAFAIWDKIKNQMFLARDRYGIKPLYYTGVGDTFLFASEIKAFLRHPKYSPAMSHKHLLEYFTFQNIFSDGCLFQDVYMLPAGHFMLISGDGTEINRKQYWDFNFEEPANPASEEEYQEELQRLVYEAVKRQLVSDVEVGTYLSGGMDSGTITAIAAEDLPYLNSFTCGFDMTSVSGIEQGIDERSKAEALSYFCKTEHYEVVLKAGDLERCMNRLIWHLEDPRVGQCYPNYYVSRLASKFCKVVLSGAGGDELFAGYPWRYYRAVVNDNFDDYIDKYYKYWHRLIPNRFMPLLFKKDIWQDIKNTRTIDVFRNVFPQNATKPQSPEEYVHKSLYFEAKTFLHGLLLVEDKLSMSHGLESRVPFLDNELVDFSQKIPLRYKLANLDEVVRINENALGNKATQYYQKTRDGKRILREVMSKFVPAEVTERVKQGFSAPDATWFRGDSVEYLKSIIFSNNAHIYDYFEPKTVRMLANEHFEAKENRRLLLWSLLSLEQWCRVFMKPFSEL